jgi:hypothetical protein
MRKKISVIPHHVQLGDVLSRYVDVTDDVSGADVVVITGEADLDEIKRRAPAAVLLIAGDDVEERCRQAYRTTLFPCARIVGVGDPDAAATSIVFECDDEHEVVAMSDGEFGRRKARLGRGGIRELL